MAKITVAHAFIGSPEEMEKYAGKVPNHLSKLEKRMTKDEKSSFATKINPGTVMEVSDKRAKELDDLGLTEKGAKAQAEAAKEEAAAPKEKAQVMTSDNVKEKKSDVQPTAKAKRR